MSKSRLLQYVRELALEVKKPGEPPFKLKNGGESNFYLDCRRLTLHSLGLQAAVEAIDDSLRGLGVDLFDAIDAIGGPCVGADPLVAALLLEHVGWADLDDDNWHEDEDDNWHEDTDNRRPCRGFLVRSAEKDHGKAGRIIGSVRPGDRCLLVEDVVTTGGSLLEAIDLIREFGAVPRLAIAIVDRGCDRQEFTKRGVDFHALLTLKDLGLE